MISSIKETTGPLVSLAHDETAVDGCLVTVHEGLEARKLLQLEFGIVPLGTTERVFKLSAPAPATWGLAA